MTIRRSIISALLTGAVVLGAWAPAAHARGNDDPAQVQQVQVQDAPAHG